MHNAARTRSRPLLSSLKSTRRGFAQVQVPAPQRRVAPSRQQEPDMDWGDELDDRIPASLKGKAPERAKRNEVGVQLLSRSLHAQVFGKTSFPAPPPSYVNISKQHLKMHGLDPSQGSVLPDLSFTLPPLQGNNLDEHFHRIGQEASQPWLGLATTLSEADLPPTPHHWAIQSGWTKYVHRQDGADFHESVPYPDESAVVFDVETLPNVSPYAIMAVAATPTAWYAWVSPWLLGETEDVVQLPTLGPSDAHRVVIGHNVSYDRLRLADEYHLSGTKTRFLDTLALHVAVRGMSSHQRPAWMKHRKNKTDAVEQTREAMEGLLWTIGDQLAVEEDPVKRAELERRREELLATTDEEMDTTPLEDAQGEVDGAPAEKWEEITAANSLADVARLHCGIEMDKAVRNDFMVSSREEIRNGLHDYLTYCANDVGVTHSVYQKLLPMFRSACPSPVSFAGALTMGSAFLPVNQEWPKYLERAETTYRVLDEKIKKRLVEMAVDAKNLAEDEKWKGDPWLEQMDWTPKKAGPSRGIISEVTVLEESSTPIASSSSSSSTPQWQADISTDPFSATSSRHLPLLMRVEARLGSSYLPIRFSATDKWHVVDQAGEVHNFDGLKTKVTNIFGKRTAGWITKGSVRCTDPAQTPLFVALCNGDTSDETLKSIRTLVSATSAMASSVIVGDPWLSQLPSQLVDAQKPSKSSKAKVKIMKPEPVMWPKWYWELTKPKKNCAPGTIDLTVRNQISPILLRLSWRGWPLVRSREHGWCFRVPRDVAFESRTAALDFTHTDDEVLRNQAVKDDEDDESGEYVFYKLPHKDGEAANVGSPLGKTFMKFAQDGSLTSPGNEARDALDMNAQCSYWISARDRIMGQTVVWQGGERDLGFKSSSEEEKWGVILPQVITMGTVTRRAIEKTWLTASNAKSNRVGSELKAMVRAPPGYALVGADVDAEELWISSLLGDAQFGMHGATAVGWMTLEGTKSAGTDLHSKTGSILGISRDQAKVFNYSRIYGAGQRHAIQLLLQGNSAMAPEKAQSLAENLYAHTKGKNTHRTDMFNGKFWFGGSESFVFNKLEGIALSDRPQTPALGCGVTSALSSVHLTPGFGTDYMTSRINWAVQSSGVDYLHLLIVAMEHITKAYGIDARYLLSVHDEVRYLVREEDKYRASLALQIANLWTRSLFAYKLGLDDLPAGVAFFSGVDVDHVLRKEPSMSCVTPSQPEPLAPGESLDIKGTLERTNGTLWSDGRPMSAEPARQLGVLQGYVSPSCLAHRSPNAFWLQAQATQSMNEIRDMAYHATGKRVPARMSRAKKPGVEFSGQSQSSNRNPFDVDEVLRHAIRDRPRHF